MSTTIERTAPVPGSAEWLRYMTASKISAVMDTSPFESRFSLWHRMHGDIPAEEQNDQETYGLVIEPALVDWFARTMAAAGLFLDPAHEKWVVHPVIEWAAATPDAVVVDGDQRVPLEVKTGRDAWEWAETETVWVPGDPLAVPAGYHDQVQWQMYVMRADHAYVVADVMMSLRWYRIQADSDRQQQIVDEAAAFMASLAADQAPPIDGSTFTYMAIRQLHPDIDDVRHEVDDEQARAWVIAKAALEKATAAEQEHKNRIVDAMGTARRATWGEHTLLTRQARGTGTPYAVAARHLPTIEED